MLRSIVLAVVATAVMVLALHAGDGTAAAPAGCAGCHDLASVLPKAHAPVKGTTLAACLACHKPTAATKEGKPGKNAFATALHRAHASVDCATCHLVRASAKPGISGGKVLLAASAEDLASLKQAMSDERSGFTAGLHQKAGVSCGGCHPSTPKGGDEVGNERCLACHGPLDALQAKTAPAQFADRNPHKSHLGEIACSVCHKGHEPAVVYCLDCHPKFTMKVTGASAR